MFLNILKNHDDDPIFNQRTATAHQCHFAATEHDLNSMNIHYWTCLGDKCHKLWNDFKSFLTFMP